MPNVESGERSTADDRRMSEVVTLKVWRLCSPWGLWFASQARRGTRVTSSTRHIWWSAPRKINSIWCEVFYASTQTRSVRFVRALLFFIGLVAFSAEVLSSL